MRNIYFFFFFLFIHSNSISQNYFQQEVNYNIHAKLDDKNHTISAMMYIDYTNNSTNELDYIWFHLWPNAYKNNSTALAKHELESNNTEIFYADDNERGFIDSLEFKVNSKKVSWKYHDDHIDICKVFLNKPIKPGETIQISTPFYVKIPNAKFSRLGHIDQSYMITQWYPKPAVYDNYGWHPMPYLSQGEFYSEFGSFDVSITLPSNYTVGATGDLKNKDEINRLNSLAYKTDTTSKFSSDLSFPESSQKMKTLRYVQNNIHDFAWFADKRYHVLKGEVLLPYSKDTVTLWTMFTNNEADLWENSIEYMHDAVYYYSLWNGDYPYNHCSAVDGTIAAGGGMEYPNITVIGQMGNPFLLEQVIMHEVGHNWFYGILASNERQHPWMDEGMNSFHELRYMRKKYPKYNTVNEILPKEIIKLFNLKDYTNKQITAELIYFLNATTATDQPIELTSEKYTSLNYGGIVYSKTAIAFDYLMAYLGEEMMNKCMKTYFETWKFKHPYPKNVKNIFERVSGKDLSWFFDDLIKTTKKIDYSLEKIKKENNEIIVTIKNKGEINSPVIVSVVKEDKNIAPVWIEGFSGKKIVKFTDTEFDKIKIDYNGFIPEINRHNNTIRKKGIFKKVEPIDFQFLGSLYDANSTQIFYSPKMSYNVYNNISLGFSLYNHFLPKKGFSFKISPEYSIKSNSLFGELDLSYKLYSQTKFYKSLKYSLNTTKNMYDYEKEYTRICPSINIQLAKPNLRSPKNNFIKASLIHINRKEKNTNYIKTEFIHSDTKVLSPLNINLSFELSNQHKKVNLTCNKTYSFNKKNKINFRGFVGWVNTSNKIYNLSMSAWNGSNDYLLSENVYSRENQSNDNTPFHQQLIMREGGLKHFTESTFNSNKFLLSSYFDYKFLYAEIGTNGSETAYGSGLRIPLLIDVSGVNLGYEFFLPMYTEYGFVTPKNYLKTLRFNISFNLNSLNFN